MTADARDLLRSYLRQRAELGESELVLDGHTAAEVRSLLRGGRGAASVDTAPPRATRAPVDAPARPERPTVSAPAETPARAAPPGATPMRPAPDAPAAYAGAGEIRLLPTLDALREVSLGCPRCKLAESRRKVVFGEGNPVADVMIVGEAPGQEEDATGRPFVGAAGKLLDLLLLTAGFEREQVYICNVLKCRPPRNRDPEPEEVEACSPYLLRQVELVGPRIVIAFGAFAARTLLGSDLTIGKLRGRVHDYRGIPLVPTYHPAALLRSQAWVRSVWDDLQLARRVLAGAA